MASYPRLEQRMNVMRILWASLVFSTVLFLVVLYEAKPQTPNQPPRQLLVVAGIFALGSAVAAVIVPSMALKTAAASFRPQLMEEPTDDSLGYREPTTTRRVLVDPEGDALRFLMRYQTPMIFGLALAEAVALCGFVLSFQGMSIPSVLPFFAVCWILQITKFPTPTKVLAPILRASGAHLPK